MPHIVPLKGIYRKKKQVKITNSTSSPLFDYQAQVQPSVFDETGLVASYHFNEGSGTTAKDSSPNKNDGTITNGTYVPGQFGTALSLSGTGYAALGTDSSLGVTGNAITIEAWVRGNQGANTIGRIFWRLGGTGNYGYQLSTTGNTYTPNNAWLVSLVGTGGGTDFAFGTAGQQNDNLLHHIVATYDGTNIKGYVDGQLSATSGTLSNRLTNANSLTAYIGASDSLTNKFTGIIDAIKIFSRVLTPQEILDRYNASIRPDYQDLRFMDGQNKLKHWIEQDGKAWVKVPQIPANSSKTIDMYYGNYSALDVQDKDGLVAYYPLDGNSKDFAGGNHGTDTSITYQSGKYGQGALLNAAGDKIAATISNWVGSGDFSLVGWVNINSFVDYETFLGTRGADNSTTFSFGTDSTKVLTFYSNGSRRLTSSTNALTLNTWHHVGYIRRSGVLYGYIDGVSFGNVAFTADISNTSFNLGNLSTGGEPTLGMLDEWRLYTKGISADEIKSLYNQGLTTTINEKPEAVKGFVGKLVRFIATAQQNVSNFFLFFR